MKIFFVLATLVGVALCKNTGKIINGYPAEMDQFPWLAGITSRNKITHVDEVCGGSLISNEWVLTAAVCIKDRTDFLVVLSATLVYINEAGKVVKGVKKVVFHKDYDDTKHQNDIGLLQLDRPVQLTDYIKIIPLPKSGDILQPDTTVTISGWGLVEINEDELGSERPRSLNWDEVKTISNKDCNSLYEELGAFEELVSEKMVCTSAANKRGTCRGDSGGPVSKKDSNGNPILVAVVSYTSPDDCLEGNPNTHSRTESYLDWIKENSGVTPP